MAQIHFTARTIDSLPLPATGRPEYWDDSFPGFGIRVSPDGRKSWILMYRMDGSRRLRRLTLGTYPRLALADARDRAREALHEVSNGKDPGYERKIERKAETFFELSEIYLKEHARKKKRSFREDERIIEKDLFPDWKTRKAKEIRRSDVKALLTKKVESGAPIQANRVLALIRKIFNFGIQEEILEANPCWNVPAPAREKARTRVLTFDEIRIVWDFLKSEPRNLGVYFKLILLTAQRPGEVLKMRWDEIDFADNVWMLPAEKAKNGLPHRIPLNASTRLLLKEQKLIGSGSAWVLPSARRDGPIENVKKTLQRIREKTGILFISRDLRRTAASHMTGMGIPRLTVSKILNHVESGVTAVYDRHSYDKEKRKALEQWGQNLQAIIERPQSSEGSPNLFEHPSPTHQLGGL